MRIGIDTGGTFTDFIFRAEHGWGVHKVLSTPDNPARAVITGLSALPGTDSPRSIVHGTTVATNTLLQRTEAPAALIVNQGFEDLIVIGRQDRPRLYDLAARRPPPLVPARARFGVPGRIDHTGREIEPFDEEAARAVARAITAAGIAAAAVCFLYSFTNPAHERRMGALLRRAGISCSLSHEILAELREYERASTTIVNACLHPRMASYLAALDEPLQGGDSLRIMQSNGGAISAATAMREPVRTILSGPAGGVVGARAIGRLAGFARLITFDMGGTSTDVSLVDGELALSEGTSFAGHPIRTPMIDIHTVGAGGGSIARVDAGGALVVGPESAGADPGPICYGRGRLPTVTDANLYLGRLVPEHFLGGAMHLDRNRLRQPFADMAARLGMAPRELAEGILMVANATMERAVRVISVERGHDPREFALCAFGGAGGMHATALAGQLGMRHVIVPEHPGLLSAIGMLTASVIRDYSHTVMLPARDCSARVLEEAFAPLRERGRAELAAEGIRNEDMVLDQSLDMRYEGQSYEIRTPVTGDDIAEAFHRRHERTYGFRSDTRMVQVVNVRVRARGAAEKPGFAPRLPGPVTPADRAVLGRRAVVFEGREAAALLYDRSRLQPGNCFSGPAIVVEYSSTTVVPPGAGVRVDEHGNLVITLEGDS